MCSLYLPFSRLLFTPCTAKKQQHNAMKTTLQYGILAAIRYVHVIPQTLIATGEKKLFRPTYFTIQFVGGPGAPDVRLRTVNSELIVLEWDTPFTWNHTTIEHYKITSSNPDWTHTMYTDTSLQLQRPASSTECTEYTFTVLANNGVAEGEATTISGGFPIGKRCSRVSILWILME